MLLWILFLPLITSILTLFFGNLIGIYGAMFFTTASVLFASFIAIFYFYEIAILNNTYIINIGEWFQIFDFKITWSFLFDSLSISMCITITLISGLVHLYSCTYMQTDPFIVRFMSYLTLFTFFMLMLVTADNFIQMFLGWEGVGLCSYLLIGFWMTRVQASKSAIKAVIVNRVGDAAILIAIALIFQNFRTLNFYTVFNLVPYFIYKKISILGVEFSLIYTICLFLFFGSMAKSAQLFLHTWLPDAMEGPTPVSALIHAATMVTAGIFLILRCSFIFEYAPGVLFFIAIIGAITSLFGGIVGFFQNDFKKIIAYSTCSQLGYMVTACGFSNYNGAFFHLVSHAFFKALLFLLSGVVIHGFMNEQDIRKMGGLINIFTLSYIMFLIASLSLMGFPFLSGFYSKDFILETVLSGFTPLSIFCYTLCCLASFFTTLYSIRLIFLVFFTTPNSFKKVIKKSHEMPFLMFISLVVLFFGTLFFGYIFKDLFIGLGTEFLKNAVFILPKNSPFNNFEFLSSNFKLIPLYIIFLTILTSVLIYSFFNKYVIELIFLKIYRKIYVFLNRKFFFDYIYNFFVIKSTLLKLIPKIFFSTDKGVFETFGPTGFFKTIYNIWLKQQTLHSGIIYHYTSLFLLNIIFIFTIIEII
jgi:proton-translocating NADH-quinone oxidoreductase chain L